MSKPKIAVWKFASCDGCQLSLLDCEDELLAITDCIDIAFFPEATRTVKPPPYDISFVEGSITTPDNLIQIKQIRKDSKLVVTLGACATAGGIQSLRNFKDVKEYISIVYANPQYIDTLETSTPISDHIKVDLELRGCPISKKDLIETVNAMVNNRKPQITTEPVCVECKFKGNQCLMITRNELCMGPITHGGCEALCPSFNRGCFGCFGPAEEVNMGSMTKTFKEMGFKDKEIFHKLRSFNGYSPEFKNESMKYDKD